MAAPTTTCSFAIPLIQSPEVLLGRTLVLVAHPDDELACATLLQRVREPLVLIATDGAPHDPFFWSRYESREKYAEIRRQEAMSSLHTVGVKTVTFLNDRSPATQFTDQGLHRN